MRQPATWLLPTEPATAANLQAAGVTRQMVRTQLALGTLTRVREGVFVASSAWPEDAAGRNLVRARAEQVRFPDAVLSHGTAAIVWRLPFPGFGDWSDSAPAVTFSPATGWRSRIGEVAYHVQELPQAQVVRDPSGYAVTSVQRTAIDVAGGLQLPEALVVLDAAARRLCEGMVPVIRRNDYNNARLVRGAREHLSGALTRRWSAQLRGAIGFADPARESAAESLSAGCFELAGLPRALHQQPIRTRLGTLFPDFLWPQARVIGECDGAIKYVDAEAMLREKQREQELRDLGYTMVRWLAKEIMTHPEVVVARVGRALGC